MEQDQKDRCSTEGVGKVIRTEIEEAKSNLDQLATALDRVASDPALRAKLAAKPLETLAELGFEFDDQTKEEILKDLAEDRRNLDEWIGIWSVSSVKSGVKSAVKVGITTGVTSGVKSGVKSGITSVIKVAREQPGKPGGPAKPPAAGKPAPKKK